MTLPLFPIRFQYVDGRLEYKPFPAYYQWLVAWDLSDLLVAVQTAVDDSAAALAAAAAAQSAADAAGVAAGDAFTLATDAVTLATDATDTAIEALNTANDALALAEASAPVAPVFAVMMDEAVFNITPTRLVNTLYPYNYGVFTTTPASATKKFSAQAGTWNIHILTYKGSNAGQLTVEIDGTPIVTNLELYVASPAFAAYNHNLTSITITGDGWHTLQISCSSKHGSSSAHGMLVFKVWGERTGA